MQWIKASELKEKDHTREYIGKWRKEFVNNGQFSKEGDEFRFEKYGNYTNFDDLYILVKEGETPSQLPPSKDAAGLVEALEEIAAKEHRDKSCSLEAQGYDPVETARIGALDHCAIIARTALQTHLAP